MYIFVVLCIQRGPYYTPYIDCLHIFDLFPNRLFLYRVIMVTQRGDRHRNDGKREASRQAGAGARARSR